METLRTINIVLVAVLSLAAGLPKIGRVSQEVRVFADTGLGTGTLVVFGLLQLAGGAMLIFPKSRAVGAVVAAVMFLGSAVMLLLNAQIAFGAFSFLPVAMAVIVALGERSRRAVA